jgi:ABC-type transport system substrate-binding protein
MKKSKLMLVVGFVVMLSMVLAACQPVVTTVEVTKVVKETSVQQVVQTQIVEKTKVVEVERKAFTTPHPILGDLKVRQAIAYCTNKPDLVKSVYPLLTADQQKQLVMNTFIPPTHWAYAGDANIKLYPFSRDVGQSVLQDAGWKKESDGYRYNAKGEMLSLKFTTTNATFRQTWAAVFEKQMKDCGIQIVRFHTPSAWWFGDTTGLARRDFELGAFAWVGQADPGGTTLWACDQIPTPENGWEGQNYMGWCNDAASKGIKNANNTLIKADRIANFKVVQQEYTKDVPAIPLFNRSEAYAYVSGLKNFKPAPGEQYYNYNAYEWEVLDAAGKAKDTIVMGFTQEPASLFGIVEDAWVAQLALTMIGSTTSTGLNYDFQPVLQKQLSTIENKLAENKDVDVKEGDLVVDANGDAVALKAGVKVFDNTGKEVEYKSGTIKMKQLVVKYEVIDGIKWSDGEPLKQADFELYKKIRCDKDSGATSFITCDYTGKITFANNGYTVEWKPGVQDPLYFLMPYGWYPSHQKLADGKMLKDIPAKQWATLPEIAETPLGTGPYVLKKWTKTQKMEFEANKFWVKGAPKTPKFVIAFVAPENVEAQLLAGQIDFIGAESLAGITQTLKKAETEKKNIVTQVVASATWEHIDFNMFLK